MGRGRALPLLPQVGRNKIPFDRRPVRQGAVVAEWWRWSGNRLHLPASAGPGNEFILWLGGWTDEQIDAATDWHEWEFQQYAWYWLNSPLESQELEFQ